MYQTYWNLYTTGKITHNGWMNFCRWNFDNIMIMPQVVEIMVRMKNGPN